MKNLVLVLLLLVFIQAKATVYQISSQAQCDAFNWSSLVADDQVLFERGKSFKTSFTLSQSGSVGSPITIGAHGTGANPVITGFTEVSSWTNKGGNIWESTNAVSTLSTCNMVLINGVNTPMGKTPNAGLTSWTIDSHLGSTQVTSSDLAGTDWTGAEVVLRIGAFKINRRTITSQTDGTINWTTNTSYEPTNGSGFFIQNDIRTLDQQNEWYYNPTTKKISIYSTIQPTNVKVASIDNLVTLSGSYITIENIDFTGANNAFIYTSSTTVRRNITIQNCSFAFSGNYGINGIRASYYTISNNSFSNCQTQAIQTGGSYLTTHHISVNNNTVQNVGMLNGMQNNHVSAITAGKGAVVEYNQVINSGYHGISFYGDSITIKNNFVNGFCNILEDGGGIYTFTGSSQSATNACKIHGNIVINGIGNTDGMTGNDWPASGIYLDEKTNAVEVYDNTIANCKKYGLFTNSGIANNIHDNTVYNSSVYGVRFNSWGSTSVIFNNNKIICKDAEQICFAMTSGTNDIASKITGNNNYYASPLGTTDLFYVEQPSTGEDRYQTLSEWKTFSSQDANSLSSPITVSSDSDIYFYYNPTKNDSTVVLAQPGIDVAGQAYSSPITLSPYTSIVILRDNSTGTYYYISSSTGNDNNSGTEISPWASLTKVNSATLVPKDRILFKSGDSWYGQLVPKSGSALGDIIYSSYGSGNKPLIHASSIITSASNWTNYLGNIWKNADPTLNNTELLVNADDANNFSSVLYQANSPAVGTKTIDTGTYHSGTSSIKIACTGTGNVPNSMYLQYTSSFAMSSGKSYEFSFWTYGTSSGQIDEAWALTTSWGEIDKLQSAKTFSATTWTKMTYRFTAQNDYTACMFLVRFGLGVTSGNSIYFDDFSFKEITGFYPNIEICSLIFNNDRSFGKRKWSIGTLTSQGDWYWDGTNKILYLYSSGSPSGLYQHIRAVNKLNLISASSKSYITIDGLALKYGDYGFVGSGTDHITIKNCDVAYIGGSDAGSPVRKGNGIEFWASNSNVLLQGNKVWECFDAGISHQSSVASTVMNNITFKNNQVWNCEYGYEYFNTGSGSSTSNILIENNTFYNSGVGWGHSQRSDPSGYSIRLANRTEATHSNFIIRNNILSNSTAECQHNWDTTYNLYTINNNLYYQPTGNIVGINFTTYYTQAQFSTYKSATGWDANSLIGDPKFIGKDVGDFRLLPTSPARKVGNQGVDIGAIPFSYNDFSKISIMNKTLKTF